MTKKPKPDKFGRAAQLEAIWQYQDGCAAWDILAAELREQGHDD
jgi:hypothetical protein